MKNNTKGIAWTVGITVLVVLVAVLTSRSSSIPATISTSPAASSTALLSGIQDTPAPWIAEIEHLRDRLTNIGLPALSAEGTALHIHQHLDIFIHGKVVSVPSGIGIHEAASFISPIHVHDNTQVIHVESPTIQDFTLGQFFDIWGVKLSNACIGSYCVNATSSLSMCVNGKTYTSDYRNLVLAAHQEIAIIYGTEVDPYCTSIEIPKIPSTYTFPNGE